MLRAPVTSRVGCFFSVDSVLFLCGHAGGHLPLAWRRNWEVGTFGDLLALQNMFAPPWWINPSWPSACCVVAMAPSWLIPPWWTPKPSSSTPRAARWNSPPARRIDLWSLSSVGMIHRWSWRRPSAYPPTQWTPWTSTVAVRNESPRKAIMGHFYCRNLGETQFV